MIANELYELEQRRLEAEELERRAARERLTGKPWWDMPCRRGECPGYMSDQCCHEPAPSLLVDDL